MCNTSDGGRSPWRHLEPVCSHQTADWDSSESPPPHRFWEMKEFRFFSRMAPQSGLSGGAETLSSQFRAAKVCGVCFPRTSVSAARQDRSSASRPVTIRNFWSRIIVRKLIVNATITISFNDPRSVLFHLTNQSNLTIY